MGHKKQNRGQPGIWKKKKNPDDPDLKVIDASYESPALADMVVDLWTKQSLRDLLVDPNLSIAKRSSNAKKELENNRGILLANPIVITEDEYNDGWQQDGDDEVVLVMPNASLAQTTAG